MSPEFLLTGTFHLNKREERKMGERKKMKAGYRKFGLLDIHGIKSSNG